MRILLILPIVVSATLFAQVDRPKTFQEESEAWYKTHPPPPDNASPEQQLAFARQLAEVSAQWVKDWPDDPRAWLQRFKRLARLTSTPDDELENIGDTVLKVAKEHPPGGFRFVPFQAEVAEVWTERRLRPEQCLQLTQDAVRSVEQSESDNPSAAKQFSLMVGQGLFRALTLQMFLATELKKFQIAESAVDRMRQYLDTHRENPEERHRLEHWYLENAAALADSEGHKPDALLYYSEAFQISPEDSSADAHARQLWKELGGTEQGFNALISTIVREEPAPAAGNSESSPWTVMNKPLTAFHGVDVSGKIWTLEDLKGKTTLLSVWASWCRPCHEELPTIQRLFDSLKDRKNVQVLTVSVDENLAATFPVVQQRHFTFPIISISDTVINSMAGAAGIPRTWIIDSTGSVRFEAIGYDPEALSADRILSQLAALQ